jgi:thiol-disulfide isomerase/thioredoxin
MNDLRRSPGAAAAGRCYLVILVCGWLCGCGEQEPLKLDPGASPYYPGPPALDADRDGPGEPAAPGGRGGGLASETRDAIGRDGATPAGSHRLNTALGANEVERQVRIARRAADRGELGKAVALLDEVLGAEPINREALFVRAAIGIAQSQADSPLEDRAAAISRASEDAKALYRAYEPLKEYESNLLKKVMYREAQLRVRQGRNDQALQVLKDAAKLGLELLFEAESDVAMAALRSSAPFQSAVANLRSERLAKARARLKDRLDQPVKIPFTFSLHDVDGKTVALADFKGKVVVVDFWGTWCGPCREAIPHLIELYRKLHRSGLEIVGLSYERNASNESEARQMVKQYVQQAGIPYKCLLGDGPTVNQVPNFKAFPTTVVIDQTGKVRLVITENDGHTLELIEDVAWVLLDRAPEKKSSTAEAAR